MLYQYNLGIVPPHSCPPLAQPYLTFSLFHAALRVTSWIAKTWMDVHLDKVKFRREMKIGGRSFGLISFQEDFNPWLRIDSTIRIITLKKRGDPQQETATINQGTKREQGGGRIHQQYLFSLHSQEENCISRPRGRHAQSRDSLWPMKCDSNEVAEVLVAGLFFSGLTFPSATATCTLQRGWPSCPATRRE